MRQVDVYIEVIADSGNYEKLELFNDEEIQINSSIQNIQDLAKVYTDFTQSFTIPASPRNNRLFEHFYQTDVDANDNPNIKRNGFIEIGTIPFRSGKISIESSNVVKGRVESYSITFYGDLTSLKDKFGDDTLKDLDLSSYGFFYSGFAVKARLINASSQDVKFPLISSTKQWTYGVGVNTDIDTSSGAIRFNELFPALKVKRIFEAIQTKYNVTFDSNFFNQKLFTELFLWLKNAKTFNTLSATENVTFSSISGANIYSTYIDVTNASGVSVVVNYVSLILNFEVYVDTFLNGKFISTTTLTQSEVVFSSSLLVGSNKLEFKVRTNLPGTATLNFKLYRSDYNPLNGIESGRYLNTAAFVKTFGNPYVNPTVYAPNIKVSDFISGIFKMFNLTCYATSIGKFQVEPLDDWYSRGAVVDITEYVDTDEITIERHKLYKEISFDYEKSESYLNEKYFNETTNATREFGSVKESFPNYDGGDYKIDVPFENIYFVKEDITDVTEPPVAYLLNESTAVDNYDNKPILLYLDQYQSTSFYFNDGSTTSLLTEYRPLCNQVTYNNAVYSNHFSTEPSAFNGVTIDNSLYSKYYNPYLQNLFNKQNRLTKVKALFPISLLTSLKLNDRLIIRDKRYIINEMKVNLTSGEVDLSLINDFRPIANINIPVQAQVGSSVEMPIYLGNDVLSATFDFPLGSVTFTADTLHTFTLPFNPFAQDQVIDIYKDGEVYTTITQKGTGYA
jgi:hypothetical protein